jgi:hypothetical protein
MKGQRSGGSWCPCRFANSISPNSISWLGVCLVARAKSFSHSLKASWHFTVMSDPRGPVGLGFGPVFFLATAGNIPVIATPLKSGRPKAPYPTSPDYHDSILYGSYAIPAKRQTLYCNSVLPRYN